MLLIDVQSFVPHLQWITRSFWSYSTNACEFYLPYDLIFCKLFLSSGTGHSSTLSRQTSLQMIHTFLQLWFNSVRYRRTKILLRKVPIDKLSKEGIQIVSSCMLVVLQRVPKECWPRKEKVVGGDWKSSGVCCQYEEHSFNQKQYPDIFHT